MKLVKIHLVLFSCQTQELLFKVVNVVLVRCSLPIGLCRVQAYDGASNLSGIRSGVQTLVKREAKCALYVHCFAHSLNLCVQEVSKGPKRSTIFSTFKKEITISNGQTPRKTRSKFRTAH